tara:strand:+ start:169908 stop:172574 length:2667 start_codon:yes stop_codon:yes gene_type:complete
MLLGMIKEKIETLMQEQSTLNSETFKERLVCTYQGQLLEALNTACTEQQSISALKELKDILARNWTLVQGTLLSYTARPEDELTLLLCDIAEYISQNDIDEAKSAIDLLMPGIATESIDEGYPDLSGRNAPNIKEIIKTHIQSKSGAYLIPVGLLAKLTLPWGAQDKLFNYYYCANMPGEEGYVCEEDYHRLLEHSPDTQALSALKQTCETLILDGKNLLGHVHQLIQSLRSNNAYDGIGTQERAGERVYTAIIAFNEYYRNLGDEARSRIPDAVKSELELLLNLSSDKTVNINATETIQTCIKTRQAKLEAAIKSHESELAEIDIDGATKRDLVEKVIKQFESAKKHLTSNYKGGTDNLGISVALLTELNMRFSISSKSEFKDFMTSSIEEIKAMGENNSALREQIIEQLATIESFVIFCVETGPERLHAILSLVGNDLAKRIITQPSDFSACCLALEGERFEVVCCGFKNHLFNILRSGGDFGQVLLNLNVEQRTAVYEIFKDRLPSIIKSSQDFLFVLTHLTIEQRTAVYIVFKEQLPSIIKDISDFCRVLECLSFEQRTAVYEIIKDYLATIIQCVNGFRAVFERLNNEQRTDFYEIFKDRLASIIKYGLDIGLVFYLLNDEQRTDFYELLKDRLPSIINNANDLGPLLRFLNVEQLTAVCMALEEHPPRIINCGNDFRSVVDYLNAEQCAAFCGVLKNHLPSIIKTGSDFNDVLVGLNVEQRTDYYEFLKDRLPSIIKNGADFAAVLEYLNDEQRTTLYETFKDQLPSMIESGADFGFLLKCLNNEQCIVLCRAIDSHLHTIIKSHDDYLQIFERLESEKYNAVFEIIPNYATLTARWALQATQSTASNVLSYFSLGFQRVPQDDDQEEERDERRHDNNRRRM